MSPEHFPVVDVTSWAIASEEAAGGEEKVWLAEPDTSRRWLFKPVTSHDSRSDQGEDWAEKAVAEIGRTLGIPCANVELGLRDSRPGALSLDLRPPGWELHHGSVIMPSILPGYRQGALNPAGRPGHSIINIRRALEDVECPPYSSVPDGFDAFDVFAGYLVLDSIVANRDRHDDNWAILRPLVGEAPAALSGSYDHAGSLGYNVTEAERSRRLHEGKVEEWALRGSAWRFEHVGKPRSLVELACEALREVDPAVKAHWVDRVERLSVTSVTETLSRVPGLSEVAATFAAEVVAINRRRLLDEC